MVKKSPLSAILGLALCITAQSLLADEVSYSDNPSAYDKTAMLLEDVFGSSDPASGNFAETYPPSFVVNGPASELQDVTFNFLYEDGGYTFEFGYFILTDQLMGMPTNTAAEKEAWGIQALSTAQTLIVDRRYTDPVPADAFVATPADPGDPYYVNNPSDPDDYMGKRSSVNSTSVQLYGGTRIEFFIIPNNTLANFQDDPGDFSLTGSSEQAWPLFSYAAANPGNGTGGAGEGLDQVMTFDGTTTSDLFDNGIEEGTMVAFEDIRRRGTASDEDFSDLMFFIGNVHSDTPVPEPATVFAGIFLSLGLATSVLLRRKQRAER